MKRSDSCFASWTCGDLLRVRLEEETLKLKVSARIGKAYTAEEKEA